MELARTFDLLARYEKEFSTKTDALAVKRGGKWDIFTIQQYRENVDAVSYALLELGIAKGDCIATVSNNRPEWNFTDFGLSQIGAVHVSVYPTIGTSEYEYILNHCEAKVLIVSSDEYFAKIKPIVEKVPSLKAVYTYDKVSGQKNFSELVDLGKKNASKYAETLVKRKAEVKGSDLLTLIYTSGTTGLPKGVMLTHNNLISNVLDTKRLLPLTSEERALSFLPLCHVLERMVIYLYHYGGVSIYYAESVDTISDNLKEVKPQGMTLVPRLLERVYDKFVIKGQELTGMKRGLYFWALNLAERYELGGKNGIAYEFMRKIADGLIYKKWREALGGNLKVIVSGGAALQPKLARVFWCADIKIQEGYGLTETSPVIAVNQRELPYVKFGTVGPVIDNVQVKIAEDGEILVKGPNVMMGYYKDEEKTAEVIDKDGWFHTGDIGVLHEHNILQITDRKKEIFKLSTGKYVAPQAVENKLKESIFIEQAMILGDNEKFAGALIVPNFAYLVDWCKEQNIHYRDNIDLIENPKVVEQFNKEVAKANADLAHHEQVKKFELVGENWTVSSGELSPTLKLKRKQVKQKYETKIKRVYGYTDEVGHVGKPMPVQEVIKMK